MPATSLKRPASFAHMFTERVTATPDAEAFRYPEHGIWRSLTWKQTKDRVYALAAGLIELGVAPEQRVAITSSTRIDWILADFAIMCAGAATTTVYPTTAAPDMAYILSDSGSVVVFAEDPNQLAKIRQGDLANVKAVVLFDGSDPGDDVLTLDELAKLGAELLERSPDVVDERIAGLGPESLSTLIYTSGTTGTPKGVRLVHDNWTYEAVAVDELHILSAADVQYLWLPLSHVFGKMLLSFQLRIGFATAVDGNLDRIVENLSEIRPTWMAGAPRIFEKVRAKVTLTAQGGGGVKAKIFNWAFAAGVRASELRQAKQNVPALLAMQLKVADRLVFSTIRNVVGGNIRFFVSGSAALSKEVAEWFDAAGMTIIEGYGLTESSAAICVNLPHDFRIGTVGPALPGSDIMIAADGEILLRGPGIMRGYHNAPELTNEVLDADGWLHTGDIGDIRDGYLAVTDRKKDLIKTSGGKYVAPQKVEGIFMAVCPYASQIVVVGENKKFISALITLDPDAITAWARANGLAGKAVPELANDPQVRQMIGGCVDDLNSKLERWETIKRFEILEKDLSVEEGELTPSMKVRRKTVIDQYAELIDGMYDRLG